MPSPETSPDASVLPTPDRKARAPRRGGRRKWAMGGDRVVGDGGNVTVYERPDGSRYALDKRGGGSEWSPASPILGRFRFDARGLSSGSWPGSRSRTESPAEQLAHPVSRARRRGSRFSTGA